MRDGPEFDLIDKVNQRNQRHRVALRMFALAGLSVICTIVPEVGAHRWLLAGILAVLVPVPYLLTRAFAPRHLMRAQSCFDVLSTACLIWFIPDVWTAGLVIVVGSPAASAALIGRRFYVRLQAIGLPLLALAGWGSGADHWVVPWLVAVLLVPLIASYVDVFLRNEHHAVTQLSNVVHSAPVIFWEMDARTGEMLATSGRIQDILGWDPDEHLTVNIADVMHPEDLEDYTAESEAGWPVRSRDARFLHAEGHYVWLRTNFRADVVRGREILRGLAFDVSELVTAQHSLRHRAEHDDLTGLINRSAMLELLETRLSKGLPIALYLLDLDRFKEVNDTLGHHAGDQFLREIATRLARVVDGDAVVARLGGDEFAVVTTLTGGSRSIHRLASRLAEACERPVVLEGLEFAGSASTGIAIAPDHGTDPHTLLRRADSAMYAAKRSGRQHHVFDFSADEPTVDRLTLSGEVEHALAAGELRLWFQPKVELATGRIVGAEGLLRWHHPTRGVLAPNDFLDVVEISRHYRALTHEVIRQGIAFAATTRDHGHPLKVAVNVSMRNLLESDLADRVQSLLAEHKLRPSQLVLEVTEREIMDDRGLARVDTEALRAAGVGLSIDDFGTGHSSLVRLQSLPVTELKIDRRFVAGLGHDDDAPILVRSLVDLAHNLGLTVVAEGVERQYEVDFLVSVGCQFAQGWLFAAAIPADEFLAHLATGDLTHRVGC